MTREEKIELIERERDGWQDDADDHKRRGCVAHYEHEQAMADVLTEAVAAVRGPQPDPSTGLLPCGCGGALKFERFNDGFFDLERIACECGIEITSGPGFCKPAWNRAMGWREKE